MTSIADLSARLGYDLSVDARRLDGNVVLRSDNSGFHGDHGPGYHFWQIDVLRDGEVLGHRMLAEIPAGSSTEPGYWTGAVGAAVLEVHAGAGDLVSAREGHAACDELRIGGAGPREVALDGGTFYFLRNEVDAPRSLVVSGFYGPGHDWARAELGVDASSTHVVSPDGDAVRVPEAFRLEVIEMSRKRATDGKGRIDG